VIGEPTLARGFGILVKSIFRKAILVAQVSEGSLTLQLLGSGKGAGGLPSRI
jgi:hypothetical protein